MRGQIIQNHHLARAQGGREPLPHPSQKHFAVHGAFKKPRSAGTLQTNARDQRAGLIVSVRDARPQSLPTPRPAPQAVILVLAPLLSTNTRWAVGSPANSSCQRALFSATSGRSCSAAARVFFKPPTQPPQPEIDRGGAEGAVQARAQLGQRGVGLCGEKLLQTLFALFAKQRLASTQIRPGLQRAALPKPLAHATHRRDAEARKLRDLPRAPAAFVEFQDALADRNRYGSHEHTLIQRL